ncbi:ATP10 protein-domain-containing protein [Geranomyces variabilis]|nr:ATP10 protein-domain-containing protein [Geranomyces variabilis]
MRPTATLSQQAGRLLRVQGGPCSRAVPTAAVLRRTMATNPPPPPKLPPLPPMPPTTNDSSAKDASSSSQPPTPPSPPSSESASTQPKPETAGILNRFAAKLRQEVEDMETAREAKERAAADAAAAAAAGTYDPLEQPPASAALEEKKKKPGFLSGIDNRLQEQRKELETAQLAKREAGKSSRVSPQMKKQMDKYLDLETNLKEREDLLKQAFRDGYWDDYKEAARKGQKLWEAPKRLRHAHASPVIPNPESKSLTGEITDPLTLVRGKKASLVTFMFSAFGEGHVNSYTARFLEEFKDSPDVQLVQMNVEENWLKAPVLRALTPFVRRKVPVELRSNYLMHFKSILESRRAAGMSNTVLGWVNLVDSDGKIRWQAHGPAKEHELDSMVRLTRNLAGIPNPAKASATAAATATTTTSPTASAGIKK